MNLKKYVKYLDAEFQTNWEVRMNLNNFCNALFISLNLHYARYKKEYAKKGISMKFDLFSDSDDKYDDHPFGIALIVSSNVTKQTESYFIKEEHLQQMVHPYDNFIVPKIKQMIKDVESGVTNGTTCA